MKHCFESGSFIFLQSYKLTFMKKDDCFYLGRVAKTHGIKGGVSIKLDVDDPTVYQDLEFMLLDINNTLTPFFIESMSLSGDKAFVKFQDINDVETASGLMGVEVYLPLEFLPILTGTQFYFHEVIGYELIDTKKGSLGPIKSILEYSTSAIIQAFVGDKEVLIPIADEVIKEVDREGRKMVVEAPEGLIDMYLE